MIAMKHGTITMYSGKHLCRCERCRKAASAYQRRRRLEKPEVVEKNRARVRVRLREIRTYVSELKKNPCVDCDTTFPYYIMQFDHIDPRKKNFSVSRLPTLEKVKAEIKKCELVCPNCHAIRTHKRRAPLL